MASIRKREWTNAAGVKLTAWQLSYADRDGKRHRAQFATKREADSERTRIEGDIASGVFVSDKNSISVLDAAKAYLADFEKLVEAKKRERSTFRMYQQHVHLHIAPFTIAEISLARLTGPDCVNFASDLEGERSDNMAKRVFITLRAILDFAISRGWAQKNPAKSIKIRTAGARQSASGDYAKIQIPSREQIRDLLSVAESQALNDNGKSFAIITTLLFAGLRISELRGLRRSDLNLKTGTIKVCQRADRWNVIGSVKSANSARTIPIPPITTQALRVWIIAAPSSALDLVFPNGAGNVESYANLYRRLWIPILTKANLSTTDITDAGKVFDRPGFGFHALRHAAVSAWIAAGASTKQVQMWAGHDDINFTMNVYGHLWPDDANSANIAAAAALFISQD